MTADHISAEHLSMSGAATDTKPPAYVGYKTLHNFFDGLREGDLPTKIDKTIVANLNYGTQQALLSALKTLAIMGADGRPTPRLEIFTKHAKGEPQWKEEMRRALMEAYPYLWNDDIDLARASPGELDEKFKSGANITGSTVDKVVAFFLAAAADAGIKLSPHLAKRKPIGGVNGKRGRAKGRQSRKEDADVQTETQPPPPATRPTDLLGEVVGKFPPFNPSWDDAMQARWFDGFNRLMDSVGNKKGAGTRHKREGTNDRKGESTNE